MCVTFSCGLSMQKAAAIDPEGQAGEAGEAGRAARQARLEGCYAPVAAVVRYLIDPSDAAALSIVHRDLGLDAAQRSNALSSLLQVPSFPMESYCLQWCLCFQMTPFTHRSNICAKWSVHLIHHGQCHCNWVW